MELSDKVKKKLQMLPSKPGVYLMRDRNGKVIYVGKASSLKNRVRTYFRKGTLRSADPKLRGLIRSIDDLDFLAVQSEAEATLTEGRLIKEYRPRYNTAFRDDKRFLLLQINLTDPYPRFRFCRIQRQDGATYFGPYASAASARAAKEFLEKRFGLRQCRTKIPTQKDHKHCLNDIIRFCSAPCIGSIAQEAYHERIKEACAFLRGERPELLQEIEEEMQVQAEAMHYEKAAALRDMLFLLRKAIRRKARIYKSLSMKTEDAKTGTKELKDVLGLSEQPCLIECFDISNISGTYAVASMVCAVEGLPKRHLYRQFRIRTVKGIDDPKMMKEAVLRRYDRRQKEHGVLPTLILVDGGITQLRASKEALHELGLTEIPVAGLAKRFEEIVWETDEGVQIIQLPRSSPALQVLQRIRDEAHRFALAYHRQLRSKRLRESILDDIPGIGPKRKTQLLTQFGSIARLRKATAEQIAEVPGLSRGLAKLIKTTLDQST